MPAFKIVLDVNADPGKTLSDVNDFILEVLGGDTAPAIGEMMDRWLGMESGVGVRSVTES